MKNNKSCICYRTIPVPDSINLSKMTKKQFDSKMQKSYKEMLEGKSRPAKKFFDELLGHN